MVLSIYIQATTAVTKIKEKNHFRFCFRVNINEPLESIEGPLGQTIVNTRRSMIEALMMMMMMMMMLPALGTSP